jgi:hypothetical protein
MAKYDIEDLLRDVKSFLVSNLNTQIAALNAEKNDGITLKTVDDTAYHLQYPEDRAEPSDPFLIYSEADEPTFEVRGPFIGTTHHVGLDIVLADNGNDRQIVNRLFRYRRALKDVVLANWASIAGSHKFEIHALSPTPPFKNQETGYIGRSVGITLSVSIAD